MSKDFHEILAMSERVCKILGWKPQIEYMASNDCGKSGCMFTDRTNPIMSSVYHISDWLKREKKQGRFLDYEICDYAIWPLVAQDDALAIKALEDWIQGPINISRTRDAQWNCNGFIDKSLAWAVCMSLEWANSHRPEDIAWRTE